MRATFRLRLSARCGIRPRQCGQAHGSGHHHAGSARASRPGHGHDQAQINSFDVPVHLRVCPADTRTSGRCGACASRDWRGCRERIKHRCSTGWTECAGRATCRTCAARCSMSARVHGEAVAHERLDALNEELRKAWRVRGAWPQSGSDQHLVTERGRIRCCFIEAAVDRSGHRVI